jgi:hypothetical protein
VNQALEIHGPDGSSSLPGGLVSEIELDADTQTIDFSIAVLIITYLFKITGQVGCERNAQAVIYTDLICR